MLPQSSVVEDFVVVAFEVVDVVAGFWVVEELDELDMETYLAGWTAVVVVGTQEELVAHFVLAVSVQVE